MSDHSPNATYRLEIPRRVIRQMVEHCQVESPRECCGILGGKLPRVSSFHPLRNRAEDAEARYDADPLDILAAHRELRARGHAFLAIYHSHPRWQAIPSQTDLSANYYGDLPRIIVSLLTDPPEVRMWRLEPTTYHELPWIEVEE